MGDYSRIAHKLLDSLLPDLTDSTAGRPFTVAVTDSSACAAQLSLPATNSRPARNLTQRSTVVVKGFQQRWVDPSTKEESFCGFVVVCNLCMAPSSYTLAVDESVQRAVNVAHHQFDTNYNVSIHHGHLSDIVPGYGTSILRLGCQGFTEGL